MTCSGDSCRRPVDVGVLPQKSLQGSLVAIRFPALDTVLPATSAAAVTVTHCMPTGAVCHLGRAATGEWGSADQATPTS